MDQIGGTLPIGTAQRRTSCNFSRSVTQSKFGIFVGEYLRLRGPEPMRRLETAVPSSLIVPQQPLRADKDREPTGPVSLSHWMEYKAGFGFRRQASAQPDVILRRPQRSERRYEFLTATGKKQSLTADVLKPEARSRLMPRCREPTPTPSYPVAGDFQCHVRGQSPHILLIAEAPSRAASSDDSNSQSRPLSTTRGHPTSPSPPRTSFGVPVLAGFFVCRFPAN